ncbi:unnamed protein product [Arctogadus glacialis]
MGPESYGISLSTFARESNIGQRYWFPQRAGELRTGASRIFSPLCGVFCLGSLRLVASPLVPARFILQKVHYAVSVRRQSFLMS